jgi:hypothetical protein
LIAAPSLVELFMEAKEYEKSKCKMQNYNPKIKNGSLLVNLGQFRREIERKN